MRRIVTGIATYLAELGRNAVQAWTAFFFKPCDPTSLGLIRLVVGLLAFWSLSVYGLDLDAFFGADAWANPESVVQVQGFDKPLAWSFWFSVPQALLRPVWVICLLIFVLFTVGAFSRVTAVLAWVIYVSTVRRVPVSLFGFDQVMSSVLLYLAATGASGQAVSLDRFYARWRLGWVIAGHRRGSEGVRWDLPSGAPEPTISANIALRLIQLHLCLIYGMAGLAKLQGQGWWNGQAIWGTLASGEFRVLDFTWLAAFPWLLNALTHASLALEIGYPVLIWVRPLRPLLLAMVVMFHVGIGLTAPGLSEFGLAMIAGNLAFVSGPWLRSLVTGLDRSRPAGRLLFDGACPRCRASLALISAADPDRMIEPLDLTAVDLSKVHPSLSREACMKAMHMVQTDGTVFVGYDAVVIVGRMLPLFWPAAVIGGLPGIRQAGRIVYQKIADSRPRDVVCNDDVCSIHGPVSAEKPTMTFPRGKR